jgi:dTDP-4-amino-4,6-dideoxygalactose transaminase
LDVEQLAGPIGPKTRAILPVHLYGQMADLDPVRELSDRNGLLLVEDAAQAHGAEYRENAPAHVATWAVSAFIRRRI